MESEKKVKGNGKRERREGGRKAEGLKSINFKSQSRRLTVITLEAGYLLPRVYAIRGDKETRTRAVDAAGTKASAKAEGGPAEETQGFRGARHAAKEIDVIRFSNSR